MRFYWPPSSRRGSGSSLPREDHYYTWKPDREENPTSYTAEKHGYTLRVDRDDEFSAWTWIIKDLETGDLLTSGMSRYDGEAIKAAERAANLKKLGVNYRGY